MSYIKKIVPISVAALFLSCLPVDANAINYRMVHCSAGLHGCVSVKKNSYTGLTTVRKTYYKGGYHSSSKKVYRKTVERIPPNFPSKRIATGNKVFIFDPNQLAWAAYDESGNLVQTGPASGGRGYCPDIGRGCKTPSGTFSVYSKGGADCKSSKFPVGRGGAPMPYCMYFSGGYAIHGSYDVPNYNASHGCIRVLPTHADWLTHNFVEHGTTVIVKPY